MFFSIPISPSHHVIRSWLCSIVLLLDMKWTVDIGSFLQYTLERASARLPSAWAAQIWPASHFGGQIKASHKMKHQNSMPQCQPNASQASCACRPWYASKKPFSTEAVGGILNRRSPRVDRTDQLLSQVVETLRRKFGDQVHQYAFPPPVFAAMQGEFLAIDLDSGTLTVQFPVLESYLNPYGTMQGGMIAAAVDNTLGPLSVLVAPPNVTRRLEMAYSRPVTPDLEKIVVTSRLLEQKERWLFFRADVYDPGGRRLARARATHWIIK
jgi:acyl-coenzyme A thioesterase PaaI-like protein